MKAAAKRRWEQYLAPAVAALAELLEDANSRIRLRAAIEILDRAGVDGSRGAPASAATAGSDAAEMDAEIEAMVHEIMRVAKANAAMQDATSMGADFDGLGDGVPDSGESVPGGEEK